MNKPHFSDIARDLTERIASGGYPVGSYLPTELELRDLYGTSRHTVRAALLELQRLGLVSRRKNAGTRIESAQPTSSFRPSLASLDDLVQFGTTHLRVVQHTGEIVASDALAKTLQCRAGDRWVCISSLRIDGGAKGAPVGWTDVYVDPAYAEVVEAARATPEMLVSTLIEARYGRCISQIQQNVNAVIVSPDMAQKLNVEAGTAALEIVRRYLDAAGVAFEISVSVHPADRFSMSMTLRRSDA
ncbi:GntR family transcriptional regulator [Paraburkholderia caballeronis]|uniref:DNA-binding transcriptional regulator, GntR family n=1 Tax=Paraburkholderia caballeronis TaxID=416943 RepID=A0A1H7QBK2_9BURK|nr:GntR family transcriptional regulator [Paraburkholderia caballeronis]PXW16374.1 DNA-binding GntR family transcriptional regulator [Paraburkholderia caballeronis]PXW94051.1 DNA-binding GntR family transcriptional regulator [Paraburkholderia caballeronis]RAJ89115.1 DNA-binding GntR family transcriptional regulator [Paraburkholderia caballeronis]TDV14903.1 DNA-binding GntR family transcriptional regulator [Paraburkholderia caballeronis]TDV16973.1 DNA-binding GntR family transcriptional regulat